MVRATVDKKILDALIRAKVATLNQCHEVVPLPVQWQSPDSSGVNWRLSGWSGDNEAVRECDEKMLPYLNLLRSQFRISP